MTSPAEPLPVNGFDDAVEVVVVIEVVGVRARLLYETAAGQQGGGGGHGPPGQIVVYDPARVIYRNINSDTVLFIDLRLGFDPIFFFLNID